MEAEKVILSTTPKPNFKPVKAHEMSDNRVQFRKIPVPSHRLKPLRKEETWLRIYELVFHDMNVDIRMNPKRLQVELKTKPDTPEIGHLQKCADFVHAFILGFDVEDAKCLFQLDAMYVDSFEVKDVKMLRGDHLSRAIGRISGKCGRTKHAIENATTTRIVVADTRIHILGSFAGIKVARNCLCSLILGSPAAKVYSKLRQLGSRLEKIA
ncbi:hypothetical protein ACJIZ3_005448 [Penstemon smallii]|uniref:PNO1 second type I KH domain-containing protein n=1 Tax=Penstemon smallii TaxID=265156 RepID=A0ABD3S4Y3_9LAMI